jgi:Mg2+ and Co2+ transporter CorA
MKKFPQWKEYRELETKFFKDVADLESDVETLKEEVEGRNFSERLASLSNTKEEMLELLNEAKEKIEEFYEGKSDKWKEENPKYSSWLETIESVIEELESYEIEKQDMDTEEFEGQLENFLNDIMIDGVFGGSYPEMGSVDAKETIC